VVVGARIAGAVSDLIGCGKVILVNLAWFFVGVGAKAEFSRPHEDRARARGHRCTMARLRYARGRLLGAMVDLPAARGAFEESLALLDGLPLRYDLARVNFPYG
jgi:hypothetical protein